MASGMLLSGTSTQTRADASVTLESAPDITPALGFGTAPVQKSPPDNAVQGSVVLPVTTRTQPPNPSTSTPIISNFHQSTTTAVSLPSSSNTGSGSPAAASETLTQNRPVKPAKQITPRVVAGASVGGIILLLLLLGYLFHRRHKSRLALAPFVQGQENGITLNPNTNNEITTRLPVRKRRSEVQVSAKAEASSERDTPSLRAPTVSTSQDAPPAYTER